MAILKLLLHPEAHYDLAMDILLTPELEMALHQMARRQGVSPSEFVKSLLYQRLGAPPLAQISPEDWERLVLHIGVDCGVSLSNEALSSNGLYD